MKLQNGNELVNEIVIMANGSNSKISQSFLSKSKSKSKLEQNRRRKNSYKCIVISVRQKQKLKPNIENGVFFPWQFQKKCKAYESNIKVFLFNVR